MINHLRIDNRLIHGQVAVVWRSTLDADAIIVCNDKVAHDPIQRMALPLSVVGEKVLIFTIDEMVEYDKQNPDENKFVICKTAADCLELLSKGVAIDVINVGNQAPEPGTAYKMLNKSISATKEEAQQYREIARLHGGHLESQMVPSYNKEDVLALLKKAGL